MNLAFRDIRHSKGRFLLTCFGLALLLGVVLSMIGIYRGLVADALTMVRAPQADIWVVESHRRGPFAESSRIPSDTREAIARLHGVEATGALTFQTIESQFKAIKLRLYVVGYELGGMGKPEKLIQGRQINRDHYEAVIDKKSGLAIGDDIKLGKRTFTIVGLTENMVSSAGDPVVYLSLKDSQELQFKKDPTANRLERAKLMALTQPSSLIPAAQVGEPAEDENVTNLRIINVVVARLSSNTNARSFAENTQRWKHLTVFTQQEQEDILTQSVVDKARKQIGLFTSLLLVVSTVIIALIIYTMTMDKIREIATLKLIGAPDSTIIGLIVQQALAMGIIGFGLGALLIFNIKDHFPRRVVLVPQDGLMLALVILIVCLIASGLGVRLALKTEPSVALGG
jgi:putative ABC transport system permease protein